MAWLTFNLHRNRKANRSFNLRYCSMKMMNEPTGAKSAYGMYAHWPLSFHTNPINLTSKWTALTKILEKRVFSVARTQGAGKRRTSGWREGEHSTSKWATINPIKTDSILIVNNFAPFELGTILLRDLLQCAPAVALSFADWERARINNVYVTNKKHCFALATL